MSLNNSPISNFIKAASVSRRLFLCDNDFHFSTEATIYAIAPRTDTASIFACHQTHASSF
jgi:hypothetical protein